MIKVDIVSHTSIAAANTPLEVIEQLSIFRRLFDVSLVFVCCLVKFACRLYKVSLFSDFYLYRDSPRYKALIQLGFNSCSYLYVVSQNSIAAANSGSNIGSDRAVIYISTFYST